MKLDQNANIPLQHAANDSVDQAGETVLVLPHCPNGHSLPEGVTFCPTCGTFVEASVPAPPTTAVLPSVPGYELLQELGRGGMGVVYKARHTRLNRIVALKMILAGDFATADIRQRFQREAEAVARIQHPNVVQLHEIGETGGKTYFSLEFVDGASLADRLRGKPLTPTQAARLVLTLAKAVHCAHEQGIVHRDLKPANILIAGASSLPAEQWTPKIADFGLAKHLNEATPHTQSGAILGTPSYMAPEQASGAVGSIGPATDVYALGTILYETLTGRPPFLAPTPLETITQVLNNEPRPVRRLQGSIPKDLETICLKCLNKEPNQRYHSAETLAADLERLLSGEPIHARRTGIVERLGKWVKRRPTVAALIVVIVLVIFGLLGLVGSDGRALGLLRGEKFFEGRPTHYWAAQLASADRGKRDAASARLRAGPPSLPVLADIIANKSGPRQQAVSILGQKDFVEAVPLLIRLLEDCELDLRADAVETLGKIGPAGRPAVPALYALLHQPDDRENLRTAVASAIEGIGGDSSIQGVFLQFRSRGMPGQDRWHSLAFTWDGKKLLAHRDGAIHVWSCTDRSAWNVFTVPDGVRRSAVQAHGKAAVVADVSGVLALYRLADQEKLAKLGRLAETDLPVTPSQDRLVFSPDGNVLAIIRSRTLELYEVTHNPYKPLNHVQGLPNGSIDAVIFSADSQTFAVLANAASTMAPRGMQREPGRRPGPVVPEDAWWVFERESGMLRKEIGTCGASAILSPDGRLLAAISRAKRGEIGIWDTGSGDVVAVVGDVDGAEITRLVFVAPHRLAVATASGALELWDVRSGKKFHDLRWHTDEIQAMAVSPDRTLLASADARGWVKLWNLDNYR